LLASSRAARPSASTIDLATVGNNAPPSSNTSLSEPCLLPVGNDPVIDTYCQLVRIYEHGPAALGSSVGGRVAELLDNIRDMIAPTYKATRAALLPFETPLTRFVTWAFETDIKNMAHLKCKYDFDMVSYLTKP
jgi:hypothetical protein